VSYLTEIISSSARTSFNKSKFEWRTISKTETGYRLRAKQVEAFLFNSVSGTIVEVRKSNESIPYQTLRECYVLHITSFVQLFL